MGSRNMLFIPSFLASFLMLIAFGATQARADNCLSINKPISFSATKAYVDSNSLIAGKIPKKSNGVFPPSGGVMTIFTDAPVTTDGQTTLHQRSLDLELELTLSPSTKSPASKKHSKFERHDLNGIITILPGGLKRIATFRNRRNSGPDIFSYRDTEGAQKSCITGIAIDASFNQDVLYGATIYIYFDNADSAVELYSVQSNDDQNTKFDRGKIGSPSVANPPTIANSASR
jgi:hypothetical protein